MVVEITPIGIQDLRWKFYIIWTVLNGSFVPFTYFLYPETAGRTLEDIDMYFREKPSLIVFRDKVRLHLTHLPLFTSRRVTDNHSLAARHFVHSTYGVYHERRGRGASQELRQSQGYGVGDAA